MPKYENSDKIKLNKSEDPIYRMHEYHLDIQNNHVYLFGNHHLAGLDSDEPGVEFTLANRFIINMHACMRASDRLPVVIHMKTAGGSYYEGMAIFNMLISYPFDTTILNYTHVESVSSIIFQAATKRVMMPNSHFMFHEGTYSQEGNLRTVLANIDFYRSTVDTMLNIYALRMKQRGKFSHLEIDDIKEMLQKSMQQKDDIFLTAEEAVEWGLADEIFNGSWTKLTKYSAAQETNIVEFSSAFLA